MANGSVSAPAADEMPRARPKISNDRNSRGCAFDGAFRARGGSVGLIGGLGNTGENDLVDVELPWRIAKALHGLGKCGQLRLGYLSAPLEKIAVSEEIVSL